MIQDKLENVKTNEIITGIHKSIENAMCLIDDGDILLKSKRVPRAYCLYQLAVEEVGKSRLLFSLLLSKKLSKSIDYKKFNSEFTLHKPKSRGAIVFEKIALLLMYSEETLQIRKDQIVKYFRLLNQEQETVEELNNKKNLSLYLSIVNKQFKLPTELIDQEMTQKIRQNAINRINAAKSFMEIFLSDIERLVLAMKEVGDDPSKFYDEEWAKLITRSREE